MAVERCRIEEARRLHAGLGVRPILHLHHVPTDESRITRGRSTRQDHFDQPPRAPCWAPTLRRWNLNMPGLHVGANDIDLFVFRAVLVAPVPRGAPRLTQVTMLAGNLLVEREQLGSEGSERTDPRPDRLERILLTQLPICGSKVPNVHT
jgi:hypothetical protein